MNTAYHSFLRRLIVYTLIVGLAGWGVMALLPKPSGSPVYVFIVLFFFSFTLLQHKFIFSEGSEKLTNFANRFMLVTILKLLLFLVIILIYVLLVNPSDAIPFLISFLAIYLLFTGFEVVEMLKENQKKA